MTDYCHSIIDAIHNKTLTVAARSAEFIDKTLLDKEVEKIEIALRHAHRFDISAIEPTFCDEMIWTAKAACEHKLLPLPFEITAFSARINIIQNEGGTHRELGSSRYLLLLIGNDDDGGFSVQSFVAVGGEGWLIMPWVCDVQYGVDLDAGGARVFGRSFAPKWVQSQNDDNYALNDTQNAIQALLCLGAKGLKEKQDDPPPKLNKAREKRGACPLFAHTVVTIGKPDALSQDRGGTHSSPRFHWRRGHVRTLTSGVKTLVRPCVVGNPLLGTVNHDYKVVPSPTEITPSSSSPEIPFSDT